MPEALSTKAPRLSPAHTCWRSQAHHKPPWQSCEQLFLVQLHTNISREQAKRQQTNKQWGSGAGFCPMLLHMPPETPQGQRWHWHSLLVLCPWEQVTPACILGRQIRAAQPHRAGECPHATSSPLQRHWWEVFPRASLLREPVG